MTDRVPGASNDARLTSMYLAFTESANPPLDDAVLVEDRWPTGHRTLGWQAKHEHDAPPQIVCAAAIGALLTSATLGNQEAVQFAHHPTVSVFGRTRLFASLISTLNRSGRVSLQGAGLHLVAAMADAPNTLLGRATVAPEALAHLTTGQPLGGRLGGATIEANNELYFTDPVGRIQSRAIYAIRHALRQEHGLDVTGMDEHYFKAYTCWAIMQRIGNQLANYPRAHQAHAGQFVAACHRIKAQLKADQELKDVLPPQVYATYVDATERLGIYGIASPTTGTHIRASFRVDLPKRQRTFDETKTPAKAVQGSRHSKELALRPPLTGELATRIRVSHLSPERVAEALEQPPTASFAEMTAQARQAILNRLNECRQWTAQQESIAARKQEIHEILAQEIYPQHPYLAPQYAAELDSGSTRVEQLLAAPQAAVTRLSQLVKNHNYPVELSQIHEWLCLYAAASLGLPAEQDGAQQAIKPIEKALQDYLLVRLPALNIKGFSDIHNMQARYGVTADEAIAFGFTEGRMSTPVPLQLYLPAAMSLFDNVHSPFTTQRMVRSGLFRENVLDEQEQSRRTTVIRNRILPILADDAAKHFGVSVTDQEPTTGEVTYNRTHSELLIACRLAEALQPVIAAAPHLQDALIGKIMAVCARYTADQVRTMPPAVQQVFKPLHDRYQTLAQTHTSRPALRARLPFRSPQ